MLATGSATDPCSFALRFRGGTALAAATLLAAVDHQRRVGNASDRACPHGVFAARGTEQWVAIVAQDDPAWSRLCTLIHRADLAALTLEQRLGAVSMIEDVVSSWTMSQSAVEGPRFALSRTPIGPSAGGPTLGEHLYEVLTELLGYDVESIADPAAAEAFD